MLLLAAALVCADCHKELVERYARTPMANTSGIARPAEEVPGKIGNRFTITPRLQLVWPGGSVDLTYFIGSRRMGRSFAFDYRGHLYQAPAGYYANRQAWDLAPGYEHDSKPDLTRPISPDCLFCHSTKATRAAGTLNRYEAIVHGIQCQRCHGESDDHANLVNPRKLAARERDSICEQCHLSGAVRLVQANREMADFRPGQDLAAYLEVFTASSKGVSVNGHADSLAASRCKLAPGEKLGCGSCHNPHQPTASYAAVCRSCHAQPHRREDCISCHMPKAQAYDGRHTVFTDHSISTRGPRPLASYFKRKPSARNLGLAYVQMATEHRDATYLEKAWPLLRESAALKLRDPALYSTIANLLNADGHKNEAIAYYRLSLEQDPLQPDALLKLAKLLDPSAEARTLRQKARRIVPVPE